MQNTVAWKTDRYHKDGKIAVIKNTQVCSFSKSLIVSLPLIKILRWLTAVHDAQTKFSGKSNMANINHSQVSGSLQHV